MKILVSASVVLAFILIQLCQGWTEDLAQQDIFYSALQYPHVSFRGVFEANVATGNNVEQNYDIENFFDHDKYGNLDGGKNEWNAYGNNDFILLDCYVTSACPLSGNCTQSSKNDQVCGSPVKDGGCRSFAKMVDIDPTYQSITQIIGLKVLLPGFFEGEMEIATLVKLWISRPSKASDQGSSATYRSHLKDLRWYESVQSSETVNQMKKTLSDIGSDRLSIIFSLDMYKINFNHAEKGFARGRIIGLIGVLGPRGPSAVSGNIWSRSLAPVHAASNSQNSPKNTSVQTSDASFAIDSRQKKLFIGFLNSVLIYANGNPYSFPPHTKIGYFRHNGKLNVSNGSLHECLQSKVIIGDVSELNLTKVYFDFGGVVAMGLSGEQAKELEDTPLALFQADGHQCTLFMKESDDGLLLKAYTDRVFRLEAKETITFDVFVTRFGRAAPNIPVAITPRNDLFTWAVGVEGKASFKEKNFFTNETGLATITIPTISSEYNRIGIDGNLEGYCFYLPPLKMSLELQSPDSLIVARVYSQFSYPENITWFEHIRPIFQQYANLFPIMGSRTIDIANYFDVVDHKDIMIRSMSLPMSHPGYMPSTRDLSIKKRDMILKWLNQDKPALGDLSALLTKHYLLQLLQTALEVTHASLPQYLTSLWSIKSKHNRRIASTLSKVVRLQVNKIAIVASIMSSLGGKAKFAHKEFVPQYPGRLNGGVQRDLMLSLDKLSAESFQQRFFESTRPEIDYAGLWFRNTVFKYSSVIEYRKYAHKLGRKVSKHRVDIFANRRQAKCKSAVKIFFSEVLGNLEIKKATNLLVDPQDRSFFKPHTSIDNFFDHILLVLSFITDCGSNNTIFHSAVKSHGKAARGSFFGHIPIINDYSSAVNAIKRVLKITNNLVGGFQSQYRLLQSVVEETRSLPVHLPSKHFPKFAFREAKAIATKLKHKSQIRVPVIQEIDENGVWPIVSNLKKDNLPNGTLRNTVIVFNDVYSSFLVQCAIFFNSVNQTMQSLDQIDQLVKAMGHFGRELAKSPIHKGRSRLTGPNAAPSFEVDLEMEYHVSRNEFNVVQSLVKARWDVNLYVKNRKPKKKTEKSLLRATSGEPVSDDYVFRPLQENPLVDVTAAYP